MKQRITVVLLLLVASSIAGAQVSPEFFAMHDYSQYDWPPTVGVPFSSWRSLSAQVQWSDINTAPGVYKWAKLDGWLATTSQNGQSVLYTIYYTPSWASTCPTCVCKSGGGNHLGGCYPPNDLNPDGSGTDRHLKDFVAALMQHVGPGAIQYLEIWNEPNISVEYTGTAQQLVRMAQDTRAVATMFDPNVQITCPPETGDGTNSAQMQYLASYLAAGGGAYVDVIGMHGYVVNPEDIITRVNAATAVMAQYGQSGKPLFITEGSWVNYNGDFPAQQQPGFSFRHYLSMLSGPAQRFYLYAFDNATEGNLFNGTDLTPAGSAYHLFYYWLVGASMTQPCQIQPGSTAVWACGFTRSGGYQAAAVWDAALPWGQEITVSVGPQYVQYRDLYGNVFQVQNNQVPIGYDPIWLEN
ncbi:MAG: glycosyl hydrolase [Terriglobales bacterium]